MQDLSPSAREPPLDGFMDVRVEDLDLAGESREEPVLDQGGDIVQDPDPQLQDPRQRLDSPLVQVFECELEVVCP